MAEGGAAIGVDIGGTFTDIVSLLPGDGGWAIKKVLTTPDDPGRAVLEGVASLLREAELRPSSAGRLVHGTTLASNAIIERKGARTGLLATGGFEDLLEIGRERRFDIYDLMLEMPSPLVPRSLRKGVPERLDRGGAVLLPLDEGALRAAARELFGRGLEAVAICFLHSFRNPAHERRAREVLAEMAPGLAVSLSSEVVPEIREYERTSTTVANAYVQPLMGRYLERLEAGLGGMELTGPLFTMLSNGGIATASTAAARPVLLVESGPAAGALAAAHYSRQAGRSQVLSFDMGGTTAKICLIDGHRPKVTTDMEVARVHRFKRGSGLPLRVPVIEMVEIGAGGGSIARADAMGLLKVGPESAGAEPGPVCYGRGGREPTVTDANLILGYLNPDFFLGGEMRLDAEAAREALRRRLAEPLGVSLARAAWGVLDVVDESMANSARMHAIESGRDIRAYTLVAFGGAGPLHAHRIARKLKLREILCPPGAGVASAFGLLVAPPLFHLARAYMTTLADLDLEVLNRLYAEMESEGRALLARAGIPAGEVSFARSADMRYRGQGFEVSVPLPAGRLGGASREALLGAFEAEYRRVYGRAYGNLPVEVLNWRLAASGPIPRVELPRREGGTGRAEGALKGRRPVYLPEERDFAPCPVYDRYGLSPGARLPGPALVEERESTLFVGPGGEAEVDPYGNVLIQLRAS